MRAPRGWCSKKHFCMRDGRHAARFAFSLSPLRQAAGATSMNATFSAYEWLQLIGLGGVGGMLGQGARTLIGFKKLHDASSAAAGVSDMIALDRLVVLLAIGFIAGALAAITTIQSL